jgi:hypothetical protein
VVLTAVYLFAAVPVSPAFFLGPLGALLLASRPRTPREWFWIAIAIGVLAAWLGLPMSLAEQTVRASAAFFVGAFLAATLAGVRSLIARALAAVALAALATAGWFVALHFRFSTMESELIKQTWEAWRLFLPTLPATMPAAGDLLTESATTDQARQFATGLTVGVSLFPAWLALWALAGVRLAWSWYYRIARAPFPPAAGPFRDFRFNDQMVWVLVVALAAALLGQARPVTLTATNVLVVVGALYALRGTAVLRTSVLKASPMFIGLLFLMMLALFTVIPIGLALLGIADTWVDFRRRMAPPPGAVT